MIVEHTDKTIACILQLAFGRAVPVIPIPLTATQRMHGLAYALTGPGVPHSVILLRYSPQHQAQAFRAFTVMRALREQHFPVPEAYYVGVSYYTRYTLLLIEHIAGYSEDAHSHAFFTHIGTHFAQTLAQLHQLTWRSPSDFSVKPFQPAFRDLAKQVYQLATPELEIILEWLLARMNRITELPYTVIHGNYTLQTVLAKDTQVIAVQGWEQAVFADPRFDIGYTSAVLGSHNCAFSDQFLEAYSAVAGPVLECQFWEVFNALRLLTRVAVTLSTLHPPQRQRFLNRVGSAWTGMLEFVEQRTRLTLS